VDVTHDTGRSRSDGVLASAAYLESELKTQERHLTNALKDKVTLEQKLARKPARRR